MLICNDVYNIMYNRIKKKKKTVTGFSSQIIYRYYCKTWN